MLTRTSRGRVKVKVEVDSFHDVIQTGAAFDASRCSTTISLVVVRAALRQRGMPFWSYVSQCAEASTFMMQRPTTHFQRIPLFGHLVVYFLMIAPRAPSFITP